MDIIDIKNLKKYYGKTKAVDDISLTVEQGEIFGFLGPNGAGKTTTIRCMMDFLRPDSGSITILGGDSSKDSVALKRRIGYLPGNVQLYRKWTGKDHIDFVRALNGKTDIPHELIKRLDFNPFLKVKGLSSGNRQKLGIIMALMGDPDVLILDEPTASLDPLLQNVIYELLKEATERGCTVFMSSHNLAEVERVCGRVGIIKGGKMEAIETIASLKEKRMYEVYVLFAHAVEKELFEGEGVEITGVMPQALWMSVMGDINPLLWKLGGCVGKVMYIGRASLEDIFMEFYK